MTTPITVPPSLDVGVRTGALRCGLPIWWDQTPDQRYPKLEGDLEVDVAIVGAGLVGLATAAALLDSGLRVVIVERETVASGETGRTTAHATQLLDVRYAQLARTFGQQDARRVVASQREALERLAELDRVFRLDADVRRVPAYLYSDQSEEYAELEEEGRSAADAGLGVEMTREVPLPFATAGALRVDHQLRFHPVRFATALARALVQRGVRVYEGSPALDIVDGSPCRVETPAGTLTAGAVVVAAHVPVNTRVAMHTSIVPMRSYAIASRADDVEMGDALFFDTASPYHYLRKLRLAGGEDVLIVGGGDHRVGDTAAAASAVADLGNYVRSRFGDLPSVTRWSGQILESIDGLPYIGCSPGAENVYVASAFGGNGTTFAMTAAAVNADALLGRSNPYAELYRPLRMVTAPSLLELVRHNMSAAAELVAGRLSGTSHPPALGPNEGAIVKVDGVNTAVARDAGGQLHCLSPVCPHMGCHVRWNPSEATWDCGCHGSRFAMDGRVLNGPATEGLQAAERVAAK